MIYALFARKPLNDYNTCIVMFLGVYRAPLDNSLIAEWPPCLLNKVHLFFISFFEQSSFKLRFETVIGVVLCYSDHHVVFFTICTKLTMAFTLTSLPLNFYTSVLDLKKNIGRLTDLTKQKHRLVDLHRLSLFNPLLKD